MAVINCPDCGKEMKGLGAIFSCEACDTRYEIDFTCQECGEVPEEIIACGSSGFFCRKCNVLRSRTTMKKSFRIVGKASG